MSASCNNDSDCVSSSRVKNPVDWRRSRALRDDTRTVVEAEQSSSSNSNYRSSRIENNSGSRFDGNNRRRIEPPLQSWRHAGAPSFQQGVAGNAFRHRHQYPSPRGNFGNGPYRSGGDRNTPHFRYRQNEKFSFRHSSRNRAEGDSDYGDGKPNPCWRNRCPEDLVDDDSSDRESISSLQSSSCSSISKRSDQDNKSNKSHNSVRSFPRWTKKKPVFLNENEPRDETGRVYLNNDYSDSESITSNFSNSSSSVKCFNKRGYRRGRPETVERPLTPGKISEQENQKSSNLHDKKGKVKPAYALANSNHKKNENSDGNTIYVGFNYLEKLCQMNAEELTVEILKPNARFTFLLDQRDLQAEWLFLMVKIVSEVCSSEFTNTRNDVLNQICRSEFLRCVSNYLGEVSIEKRKSTIEKLPAFMNDLIVFYSSMISFLPSVAVDKDFAKLIAKTVKGVESLKDHQLAVDENLLRTLNTLDEKLEDHKKMLEKPVKPVQKRSYLQYMSERPPPDDFRQLDLYPTYEDLTRHSFGFVRPNKIKGAYDDVEHYLDVQFRLLREDFIDPLRRGLNQYLEAKSTASQNKETKIRLKFKYESLRLYPNCMFEDIVTTEKNKAAFRLNFNVNEKVKIKWENSKRFMYGSLLLFTNDDFKTFFYGTVADRSMELLRSGNILVTFPLDVPVDKNFLSKEYLMAESEVFFEPYFLVMKGWKMLNEKNFPMKKYIVDGNSETDFPYYMYSDEFRLKVLGNEIDPLGVYGVANWPTAEELGMDVQQHSAFVKAFTSEFCIIQGPPGTGKTYIGLKIVETLLLNGQLSQSGIRLPILIVCFTNHALDQFLEGILRSKYTEKIIRVGAQSKSEELKDFNLRGLYQMKTRRKVIAENNLIPTMSKIRNDVKTTFEGVRRLTEQRKKLKKPEGIVNYGILREVMTNDQRNLFSNAESLQEWLLEDDVDTVGEEAEFDCMEVDDCNPKAKKVEEEDMYAEESEEDDRLVDEDDIFLIDTETRPPLASHSMYEITLDELKSQLHNLEDEHQKCSIELQNNDEVDDYAAYINKLDALEMEIENTRRKYQVLKARLADPSPTVDRIENVLTKDIRHLSFVERWVLYRNWIKLLREFWTRELQEMQESYRASQLEYEDMKHIEDVYVVKQADVVGMTTTCAARLHKLLNALKPAIVIIEEAAEVLETHIVASLTKSCQHVVLIGDHKQLKPSSAVYKLSTDYNIDVSLFERMINNGMDCPMLNVQHRMRPNISRLITPLIYEDLKDDESVFKYEDIKGMTANLFFMDHDHYEQDVEDTTSRQNVFEADFMIELCEYLILQGYEAEKITILTTYAGQMFLLREKKYKRQLLKHVKCIVVDKYQGEENDIILLSLVRSNKEAKIGFLKTQNRVCVALSRAKMGFYIVGNMKNLAASSPDLWGNIRENLQNQNAIGEKMRLYCPRHEIYTDMSCSKDFDKVREGGCSRICGELLKCGHDCKRQCHTLDREHIKIRCQESCEKVCQRERHHCPKKCYEECGRCMVQEARMLACGHTAKLHCYMDETEYKCNVSVDDVSSSCGHAIKRECHQLTKDVACKRRCEDRLECGHACKRTCHRDMDPDHLQYKCDEPCGRTNKKCSREHKCRKSCFQECGKCTVQIWFELKCGHRKRLECSVKIENVKCYENCEKICPDCQQRCKKKCHENCSPCNNYVTKRIEECGHNVKIRCHRQPERKDCREKCERLLECGHRCADKCCNPCNSVPCSALVKVHNQRGICGHNFVIIPCFQQAVNYIDEELLQNAVALCDAPCGALLKCGHKCASTCSKCWQGRLHEPCQEPCGNVNICGHSCKYPCRQMCPPCGERCGVRCKHSRCPEKCGVPCVPCLEPCEWKCPHSKCTKKCGEMCDKVPCQEACPELLDCGHSCVGFCGEPHPSCRECHAEMKEIFLGYEDREDAKFVLLEDCGHSFESRGLETYLRIAPQGGEIVMKVCPLCRVPVSQTQRYMNHVKKTYADVQEVKLKIFTGTSVTKLKPRKKELYSKLLLFSTSSAANIRATGLEKMRNMVNEYLRKVDVVRNKRNTMSHAELNTIEFFYQAIVDIESRLQELCEEDNKKQMKLYSHDFVTKVVEFVNALLHRIEEPAIQISEQMSEDIALELQRYHKMVDLARVLRNPKYGQRKDDRVVNVLLQTLKDYIFGIERFDRVELKVNKTFENLQTSLEVIIPLTSEEKRMINEAMSRDFFNGATGHWFTCSNGHYYVITECGGPMVKSKCPECDEVIGGENHLHVSTARLAIDMDGATHPACGNVHNAGYMDLLEN